MSFADRPRHRAMERYGSSAIASLVWTSLCLHCDLAYSVKMSTSTSASLRRPLYSHLWDLW